MSRFCCAVLLRFAFAIPIPTTAASIAMTAKIIPGMNVPI
jgi:hypothetical protein